MLLGLSTNASATITGFGCIVAGNAGQYSPLTGGINSQATFQSACNTVNGATALNFTFTSGTDNININSGGLGQSTVNGILGGVNTSPVTCVNGTANCGTTIATSGAFNQGGNTAWFDFHYTLGQVLTNAALNVAAHDDGVSLFINGVLQTPNNQTVTQAAQPQGVGGATNYTISGAIGATVDLVWAECCGLPGVLQVNLPGENAVNPIPEPASIFLLGGLLFGVGAKLRRRAGLN
jgi:hypothetical protein